MTRITKFPSGIANQLGNYVYVYSDPRTKKPFYVGQGRGNRCFSHLFASAPGDKVALIKEIEKETGDRPDIDILAFNLEEQVALKIEAAAIDLLGLENLPGNLNRGHGSKEYGRKSIEDLVAEMRFEPVQKFEDNMLLIRIKHRYRSGMDAMALYESTRGAWVIGKKREQAVYACAVNGGIIREVYKIAGWYKAGQTFYSDFRRGDHLNLKLSEDKNNKRWEFVGNLAEEKIRRKYLHKSVSHFFPFGARSPFIYVGPSFAENSE